MANDERIIEHIVARRAMTDDAQWRAALATLDRETSQDVAPNAIAVATLAASAASPSLAPPPPPGHVPLIPVDGGTPLETMPLRSGMRIRYNNTPGSDDTTGTRKFVDIVASATPGPASQREADRVPWVVTRCLCLLSTYILTRGMQEHELGMLSSRVRSGFWAAATSEFPPELQRYVRIHALRERLHNATEALTAALLGRPGDDPALDVLDGLARLSAVRQLAEAVQEERRALAIAEAQLFAGSEDTTAPSGH